MGYSPPARWSGVDFTCAMAGCARSCLCEVSLRSAHRKDWSLVDIKIT
jgi:hypothetical protein